MWVYENERSALRDAAENDDLVTVLDNVSAVCIRKRSHFESNLGRSVQ